MSPTQRGSADSETMENRKQVQRCSKAQCVDVSKHACFTSCLSSSTKSSRTLLSGLMIPKDTDWPIMIRMSYRHRRDFATCCTVCVMWQQKLGCMDAIWWCEHSTSRLCRKDDRDDKWCVVQFNSKTVFIPEDEEADTLWRSHLQWVCECVNADLCCESEKMRMFFKMYENKVQNSWGWLCDGQKIMLIHAKKWNILFYKFTSVLIWNVCVTEGQIK